MVQIILVRVKQQVYNYLFENLELSASQVNEVLHLTGGTLQSLVKEELALGKMDGLLNDLMGEGFLDLFRTPFAHKFQKRLTDQFEQLISVERYKIDLIVLVVLPYFLAELAKQLKKNMQEEGSAHLLSLVGISN